MMPSFDPPTDAEIPAIAQQAIHLIRWLDHLVKESSKFLTEVEQFLAKNDPPQLQPRWCCPGCGSEDIEAVAWVRLNGETITNYEEGGEHWCPNCQTHYKRICETDAKENCLLHNQPFSACLGK